MAKYDFRCPKCGKIAEVEHPMGESNHNYLCPKCQVDMLRVYDFPHVKLNWKAYDRNETGSDRMTLRAAKANSGGTMLDDRSEKKPIVHDDPRTEGRYI